MFRKEVGYKPNVSGPGFSMYCSFKATPGGSGKGFVFSFVSSKNKVILNKWRQYLNVEPWPKSGKYLYKKANPLHVQGNDTIVLLSFRSGGMEGTSGNFPKSRSSGQRSSSQM